jgi:hypothetical protein
MGHSSIQTTERYLHYLGDDADAAGLARLNAAAESRRAAGIGGHRGDTMRNLGALKER